MDNKIKLQLTTEQFNDICAALALGAQFLHEQNASEERAGFLDNDTERARYIDARRWEQLREALSNHTSEGALQ